MTRLILLLIASLIAAVYLGMVWWSQRITGEPDALDTPWFA